MNRRRFLQQTAQIGAAAMLPAGQGWAAGAEDGVTAQTLTLGSSLPLTGPMGVAGKDITAGMRAALLVANQTGGVHGRELKLEVRDDAYIPARAVENVKQLLLPNTGCLALMSCLGTPTNAATFPLIEQAGAPLVGPITGAGSLRQVTARNVFHVRASYGEEAGRAVQQLVNMGVKDIAIVYLDNGFGKEVLREAETALSTNRLQAVGSVPLAVDGANVNEVVKSVLGNKPGAVLIGTAGVASTQLVSGLRRQVSGLPIVGLSVALFGSDMVQLGPLVQGMALTQVLPDPDRQRLGVARAYQAAMKAANETAINSTSFEGWINAQVMLEGLRRAGREVNRDKLRQALASIRRLELGDFSLGFSGSAPYVASNFVELAVLGANGKRLG